MRLCNVFGYSVILQPHLKLTKNKINRFLFATYCRCDSIVYVVKESGFRRILWLISYSVKLK